MCFKHARTDFILACYLATYLSHIKLIIPAAAPAVQGGTDGRHACMSAGGDKCMHTEMHACKQGCPWLGLRTGSLA